jgi:hypothetical protein
MRWLVIFAALVLTACPSKSPSAGGGATDAPAQGQAATAAPGATSGGAATGAPAATAPASAAATQSGPSFADLIRSGKAATYKVAYKWTISVAGKSETTEQAWTFKPPKARMDWITVDPSGAKTTLSFIEDPNGAYFCTIGGGQSFCFKTDPGQVAGQNAAFGLQESFENDPSQLAGATVSRRTIAGQQGICYAVGGVQAFNLASGTFCYTSSGVPLLLEWKQGDLGWAMEATSFSTSVNDSDFALPAPPQ